MNSRFIHILNLIFLIIGVYNIIIIPINFYYGLTNIDFYFIVNIVILIISIIVVHSILRKYVPFLLRYTATRKMWYVGRMTNKFSNINKLIKCSSNKHKWIKGKIDNKTELKYCPDCKCIEQLINEQWVVITTKDVNELMRKHLISWEGCIEL